MTKAQKQTRSNGETTRAKILDAAEALFGARGFDSVSLREITDRAEVTLALASYHFKTKERLFEEVVARRAKILTDDRLTRLRALKHPTVETVADAFMAPMFERATRAENGWENYFKVLGRLDEGSQWLGVFEKHFNETAQTFIESFCKALPDAGRDEVTRCYVMMLYLTLSTVAQHERIDQLSNGTLKARDLHAAYGPLLKFTVAGFAAAA